MKKVWKVDAWVDLTIRAGVGWEIDDALKKRVEKVSDKIQARKVAMVRGR